jgi:membrane fusion protein, multidrug efflux system
VKPPDRYLGTRPAWTLGRVVGVVVKAAVPIGVLAAAALGYQHIVDTKAEVPRRPPSERHWTVETLTAQPNAYRPRIVAYGTVVAGRQVALRALVGGEVVSVGVGLREGGRVEAGDPLVEIDSFEYEGAVAEAQANLDEAKAKLTEARARLRLESSSLTNAREQLDIAMRDQERAETLLQRGSMSQQTLDARHLTVMQRQQAVDSGVATLDIMSAQIDQLEAQITRLEWKLRQADRNLEDVVLTAPFDAYVGTVAAEVGKLVNVNDAVAVLYDRNWFDVRFPLTDAQYGRLLQEGLLDRPVEITWHVGGTPQTYTATIVRVAPEIAAQRGGVDVYARIDSSPNEAQLRPGAFVEVRLDDMTYSNVVRVPATAIYGTDKVYVAENGRLSGRDVEVVGYDGSDVLVRGGLAGGDEIVTTRITEAGDGLKVTVQGKAEPPPGDPEPQPGARGDG